MNESILTSIKKLLGIADDYNEFDMDVIIHINTAFSILCQLGIGPDGGFSITGYSETWKQFLTYENDNAFSMVKSYVYLKVKTLFDPALTNAVSEAINKNLAELEWRISILRD